MMNNDDFRWMEKCEEFKEEFKIIVGNDEVYVVDGNGEDVYTFSEYGWRFALWLLRYIGCNAEEA